MKTHSPMETRAFGERLAQKLHPGDVLLLLGDLGAGKSELTRGIAKGLGVTSTVASPSFTILNVYEEGRLPLYHFDWYRLTGADELYEMGLDEYLGGDGVAVIEWPTQCPEAIPDTCLAVSISPMDDTVREITLECRGGFRQMDMEGANE